MHVKLSVGERVVANSAQGSGAVPDLGWCSLKEIGQLGHERLKEVEVVRLA